VLGFLNTTIKASGYAGRDPHGGIMMQVFKYSF